MKSSTAVPHLRRAGREQCGRLHALLRHLYDAGRLCGVELRQTPVNADFSFPWDNLLKLVDDKTSLVFVTTPDNPSGYTPPVAELETLAKALPDTCLLVLDEAYMDFTDDEADYSLVKRLDEFPNVIISRTFSKSFGMAGSASLRHRARGACRSLLAGAPCLSPGEPDG